MKQGSAAKRFPSRPYRLQLLLCVLGVLWAASLVPAAPTPARVAAAPVFDVLTVNAVITPPVATYVTTSIAAADRQGAAGLIICLDTPGGLDAAMREIVKAILNSPIPIIVYVYPPGARAASAGVIITMAAHVAAMSPGTNIGAAHPVSIGLGGGQDKTMRRKVENDAVAYVRSIARQRGRNADWAEQAVRKSVSITATEALRLHVIDVVAPHTGALLEAINGRKVVTTRGAVILTTANAVMRDKPMGLRLRVMSAISDPNIAYLLLLVGLAGLYFEFAQPGVILPGVVGGICLILAFAALQTLPVNYAGVALIVFAIILFIAEIKVASHGILSVGGVIALVMGSLMLFNSPEPALRVSLDVMLPVVVLISAFFIGVVSLVLKAQLRRRRSGREAMLGIEGTALTDVSTDGTVLVRGEYWRAVSDRPVAKGRRVRVVSVEGLCLKIEEAPC